MARHGRSSQLGFGLGTTSRTGSACFNRVSVPSVVRTNMESTLATSRAGPHCGSKLLLAFVGALNAPTSSNRRLRFVVLELGCIILINAKGGRRHRLDILQSHRHRLVRPSIGLCCLVNVIPPSAAVPGHLAAKSFFKVWIARSMTAVAFRSLESFWRCTTPRAEPLPAL